MPRYPAMSIVSESETDYSDTDISIEARSPRRRTSFRRRSVSRQRQPDFSNAYLSPVVQDIGGLQRSASTGGRRPNLANRDHHREWAREREPPAIVVDINNNTHRGPHKGRRSQPQLETSDSDESEDESMLRNHRRVKPTSRRPSPGVSREREHPHEYYREHPYPREYQYAYVPHPPAAPVAPVPVAAPTPVPAQAPPQAQAPTPRGYSPWGREHEHPQRDYDMLVDQRLLQRNDARQDMQLMKQQAEIERLERDLARRREEQEAHNDERLDHRHEHRLVREEDLWYEDEISERMRRLERFEKKERMEEERSRAEYNLKMKRFEEAERQAAEQEEVQAKIHEEKMKELQLRIAEEKERERIQAKIQEEKLQELKRKMEEDEEKERIKQEIREEEARKLLQEQERAAQEAAMKEAAVAEWKAEEERRIAAERKAQELRDQEFKERLRMEFGYDEGAIQELITKSKTPEQPPPPAPPAEEEKKEEKEHHHRPTWIKVRAFPYLIVRTTSQCYTRFTASISSRTR